MLIKFVDWLIKVQVDKGGGGCCQKRWYGVEGVRRECNGSGKVVLGRRKAMGEGWWRGRLLVKERWLLVEEGERPKI